jgi:signal transduction histidine kinase
VLKSLELTDIVALETDDGASAYADPARVRQIMRNLVTNAVRYGADPIVVTTGQGQVTVSDHGTGVPVEDRERIFESYGRSGSHHHRDSIGLGLAISRTLATLMGGDLTYERADGKSTFRLTLSVTS